MYNRKYSAPELPKGIADVLKDKGYDLPKPKTLREFYSRLGLASDPNQGAQVGFNDTLGELKKSFKREENQAEQIGEPAIPFVEIIESLPHGEGYKKHLTEYEFKVVSDLRARYGDDYDMMAIDHKHNPMQWTAKQVQSKMKVYEYEMGLLEKMESKQE